MRHQKNNNNLILWLLVAVVAILVLVDYANARREMEAARASCYASIGKEACEANVR